MCVKCACVSSVYVTRECVCFDCVCVSSICMSRLIGTSCARSIQAEEFVILCLKDTGFTSRHVRFNVLLLLPLTLLESDRLMMKKIAY